MTFNWETAENGDITVTPENHQKKLWGIAAFIVVALAAGLITWKAKEKKEIQNIKAKITAIHENTEAKIEDSLSKRGIDECAIYAFRAQNPKYYIDESEEEALYGCPLSKLCTDKEIEHMNNALVEQQNKRVAEMHPVSAIQMASLNFYIDKNTTVEDLATRVVFLWGNQCNRDEKLSRPIRFPDDENPFMIVNTDNNYFITKTDAVAKILNKEQKENYVKAALTLSTAQEEMKVIKDVREHFYCYQADPQIQELLQKLGKIDSEAALNLQRTILECRQK